MPETTPLLSSGYFLNSSVDGTPRDAPATMEPAPVGADANEFAPKRLGPGRKVGFKIPDSVFCRLDFGIFSESNFFAFMMPRNCMIIWGA
jgi:hypothetical protein